MTNDHDHGRGHAHGHGHGPALQSIVVAGEYKGSRSRRLRPPGTLAGIPEMVSQD